jgi:hypothetical protein
LRSPSHERATELSLDRLRGYRAIRPIGALIELPLEQYQQLGDQILRFAWRETAAEHAAGDQQRTLRAIAPEPCRIGHRLEHTTVGRFGSRFGAHQGASLGLCSSPGARVERSSGFLGRLDLELRGDDASQGFEAYRSIHDEIIERHETDRPTSFDQRDAPNAVLLHKAHDLIEVRADLAGDYLLGHDFPKRRGLGV